MPPISSNNSPSRQKKALSNLLRHDKNMNRQDPSQKNKILTSNSSKNHLYTMKHNTNAS